MKRIKLTFVIVSLCFVAKSQTPYYYYNEGEKHYFNISPNKVLVQFAENTDTNTLNH